ncbi:ATP-binding protein [Streptomyces sp. NPDC048641]|uniref:NACHT domain-containing protein n=1 Tax=Streptomyces sp. NPDC048641 TaxID=3154825 RepID=UPI00343D2309
MLDARFGELFTRLTRVLPRDAGRPRITNVQLSKHLGVSESSLSEWAMGKSVPRYDDLRPALDRLRAWEKTGVVGWPKDLQLQFDRDAAEMRRISAARHTAGFSRYAYLVRLSENAYEDASEVRVGSSHVGGHFALKDLYVERAVEQAVLRRTLAASGSAQLITGEPGCGKTSLLWSLYGRLANAEGVTPMLVRASFLIEGLHETGHETAVCVEDIVKAVRCAMALSERPVVLVDTLDLLVAQRHGVGVVQDLLMAMDRLGVAVILTCRPEEAVALQFPDRVEETASGEDGSACEEAEVLAFRRPQISLGLFSKVECAAAVQRHAAAFCPDAEYGPGAAERLEHAVLDAVYQGLPVKEVCSNPLYLRLLFDLYAPEVPLRQVDAGGLFEQVRRARVVHDARAGHGKRDQREGWDLSATARALARYMLSKNTIEYRARDAGDALESALDGVTRERIDAELAELRRRGLLTSAPAGGLRFFHQTFFEFMAAEYVRDAGRGDELVDRMLAYPTDLVLAAVAGQLIPRAVPGGDSSLLRPLLKHKDLSGRALEWYADMQRPSEGDQAAAHRALSTASPVAVRRFLERLPGHVHDDPERWIADLTVVWPLTEKDARSRRALFATAARLMGQHPAEGAEFCTPERLSWWVERGQVELNTQKNAWLALFAALFPSDTRASMAWIKEVCQVLIQAKSYSVVANVVEQAEACVHRFKPAQRLSRYRRALPVFESLLDEHLQKSSKPAAAFEQAVGRLWAGARTADAESAAATLTSALDDGDRGAGRGRLHGAALLSSALDDAYAHDAVMRLRDVSTPGMQTAVVTHVYVPLLLGDDTPLRATLATACRTALATLPGPSREPGGRRADGALWASALEAVLDARLGLYRLAELLPDDSRTELWLAAAGLVNIVGAAVASGHAPATEAVKTWARASDDERERAGWSPDIGSKLRAHLTDAVLEPLLGEAIRQEQWGELTLLVDAAGQAGLAPPSGTVPQLKRLTQSIGPAEQISMWRALITHWSWAPPTPDDVAAAIDDEHSRARLWLLASVCAPHPAWRWPQLTALVDRLREDCAAYPHRQAGACAPHDALAAVFAHCHPLPPEDVPNVLDTVLDLALPDTDVLGVIDQQTAQTAAVLLGRLATSDVEEAARGLVTAAQRLGTRPNGVADKFAHFAKRAVGATLANLPPAERRSFVIGLARAESDLGQLAVSAFSMLATTTVKPPDWFRELSNDGALAPKVRTTVTSHLHRYARTVCGGPWPALMADAPSSSPR